MANLGLGNLDTLKQQLVSSGVVQSQTTHDQRITNLGLSVAALFDRFCNRKFEYAAAAVEVFPADKIALFVKRFPIVTVASVELSEDGTAWAVLADLPQSVHKAIGMVELRAKQGAWTSQLRVTYEGGYWFDTTENGSGVQPPGSTLLDEELKQAWILQCQHQWQSIDKLGVSLAEKPKDNIALGNYKLIATVEAQLQSYKRYVVA